MTDPLKRMIDDIDRDRLRIIRPTRFVFICGGYIEKTPEAPPAGLRDYLIRVRKIATSAALPFILAESAQQLYRDTNYGDLITFEEDVARISAIVLVISESAGALAELGAFCSNETIAPALRVIISDRYFKEESFVRYGPIERIVKANRDYVGVYPWRTNGKGKLVKSSAQIHYKEIRYS